MSPAQPRPPADLVAGPGADSGPDAGPDSGSDVGGVVVADVVDAPLSEGEAAALVERARAGAVVTFTGVVRDHDGGRGVARLSYSAHPSAAERLAAIAARIAAREGVAAVVARHRVGDLAIGDAALVVAVSAEHRGQAFAAAADLVDEIKAGVPIWKHQVFTDGDTEWVGLP